MTQGCSPPSLRSCRKGLHPLTGARAAGCLLTASAPGVHSKAHGAGHSPRKGQEERGMHEANSNPRQSAPRPQRGEQKPSATAAGPSLSTKQLLLRKEASGELQTAAALHCPGPAQHHRVGSGTAAPGHPSH